MFYSLTNLCMNILVDLLLLIIIGYSETCRESGIDFNITIRMVGPVKVF